MKFRFAARLTALALALGGSLVAAGPARADQISDMLQDAAGDRETELGNRPFRTPAELCRSYVALATQELPDALPQTDESFVAHAPRCTVEPQALPFAGTKIWKSLRVAHVDDGIGKASRLIVETPAGFVLGPMGWNGQDPRDPGCPSIVRHVSIDGAAVQHGRLVVIMAGERTTYVEPVSEDDVGARMELVRTPYWVAESEGAVSFHATDSFMTGGLLGSKVQPGGPHGRWVAWSAIPWTGLRAFHLDEAGAVHVVPDGRID